jgi:hypothetical protein
VTSALPVLKVFLIFFISTAFIQRLGYCERDLG